MEIQYVDHSTVSLIKSNANDLDVAKAAWVSNFGANGMPQLPEGMPSEARLLDRWYRNRPEIVAANTRIQGLINFLYRERHMSPFEHGSFTFVIDTPIFVAREFMRHRTASYNETSGRYKELEPRFYLIPADRPLVQQGKVGSYRFTLGDAEQYGTVYANTTVANNWAWNAYQNMLDAGVAREVARDVLPVNTMTQFYVTLNPRNLMQFLMLRNDDNALFEIREVAKQMEDIFAKEMPMTYEAYKKYDYREEKIELAEAKKKVAELEAKIAQDAAFETYRENVEIGLLPSEPSIFVDSDGLRSGGYMSPEDLISWSPWVGGENA